MKNIFPGITRSKGGQYCGLQCPGENYLAYILHTKTKPKVTIYFRGDTEISLKPLSSGVPVLKRKTINGNWAKEFPLYILVADPSDATDIAQLLSDVAVPLALNKRKHKTTSANRPSYCPPEEVTVGQKFQEGGIEQIVVNRYERDPNAREACIAHYGTRCVVCNFDFMKAYGQVMSEFIHVHHLKPLAKVGKKYQVDPIRDMRPVCPNCHAVIHRCDPPYKIKEVQAFLRANIANLRG